MTAKTMFYEGLISSLGKVECGVGTNHSQSVGGSLHFEMRLSVLAFYQCSRTVEKSFKFHQEGEFEVLGVTDIIL